MVTGVIQVRNGLMILGNNVGKRKERRMMVLSG